MCDIADKILQPRDRGRRNMDNSGNTRAWIALIVSLFIAFAGILFGMSERNSSSAMIDLKVVQKDNGIRIRTLEEIVARNSATYEFIRDELKSIRKILDK